VKTMPRWPELMEGVGISARCHVSSGRGPSITIFHDLPIGASEAPWPEMGQRGTIPAISGRRGGHESSEVFATSVLGAGRLKGFRTRELADGKREDYGTTPVGAVCAAWR